MLNSGDSSLAGSAGQQSLIFPMNNPLISLGNPLASNIGLPLIMVPQGQQSHAVVNPIANSLTPTYNKDSLILLPLSNELSQGFQLSTLSNLSSSTCIPNYESQAMPIVSSSQYNIVNLPTPSQLQPTSTHPILTSNLIQSPTMSNSTTQLLSQSDNRQSVGSSISMNLSVSDKGLGLNVCHTIGNKSEESPGQKSHNNVCNLIGAVEQKSTSTNFNPSSYLRLPSSRAETESKVRRDKTKDEKVSSTTNMTQSTIDSDNISKIISTLPPGWKVVGLTSLDETNMYVPPMMGENNQPLSVNTLPIIQTHAETQSPNSHSRPPDVVSIDLNVSSALPDMTTSADVRKSIDISKSNSNELNQCTVKICDNKTLLNKSISIKTELADSETEADFHHSPAHSRSIVGNQAVHLKDNQSGLLSPLIPLTSIKTEPGLIQLPKCDTKIARLETPENQWTVVGVTSIPITHSTSTLSLSKGGFPSLLPHHSSSQLTISPVDSLLRQNSLSPNSISPKGPILNVPFPKSSHSSKSVFSQGNPHNSAGSQIANPKTPGAAMENSTNLGQQTDFKNCEWTIVGVTVSPPTSSFQTSVINSNSNPISHLFPSATNNTQFSNLNSMVSPSLASTTAIIPTIAEQNNINSGRIPHGIDEEWKVVGITQLPSQPIAAAAVENLYTKNSTHTPLVRSNLSESTLSSPNAAVSVSSSTASPIITSASYSPNGAIVSLLQSLLSCPSTPLETIINDKVLQQNQEVLQTLKILQQQQQINSLMPFLSTPSNSAPNVTSSNQDDALRHLLLTLGGGKPLYEMSVNDNSQRNNVPLTSSNEGFLSPPSNFSDVMLRSPQTSYNYSSNSSPAIQPSSSAQNSSSMKPESQSLISNLGNFSPISRKPVGRQSFTGKCCHGKPYRSSKKGKSASCSRCMKKHTVSHLLRMKRMKEKGEHYKSDNDEDDDDNVNDTDEDKSYDVDNFYNARSPKRNSEKGFKRHRSSTNHKIDKDVKSKLGMHLQNIHARALSKQLSPTPDRSSPAEKINLRSGTQLTICNYEADGDESDFSEHQSTVNTQDKAHQERKEMVSVASDFSKNEGRSAARKRKLKVPRKMVADLDYHPFDSSSESN